MREIKTEDRPMCSCGRKMIIVEYSSYYETFNYFDCGYCEVDPDDYKADDYTRVLMPSESEETEMKKDIEWAIKEIKGLETEPSQNYPHDEMIEKEIVLGILNQLKEPEVLSRAFIDEKAVEVYVDTADAELYVVFRMEDLQNLLVPKQELPVIPSYVAEWIEKYIEYGFDLYPALKRLESNQLNWEKIYKWYRENTHKFVNAYLTGKYEVEEEPLYRARLKVITDEFIASYLRTQSSIAEDRLKVLEIGSKFIHEDYRHLSEFTEDELKRLNIWDSEQWEVEEAEENGKD